MTDVSNLERATLAAVPPRQLAEVHGWICGFGEGTLGRARSAAPLRHDEDLAAPHVIAAIEAEYVRRGYRPMLRIARVPAFAALRDSLRARGWPASRAAIVQVAGAADVAALPGPISDDGLRLGLLPHPDERWAQVFLGEGFDPADGASRLAILRRAKTSLFACVEAQGQVAAVGCGAFSNGWCGIHGMRTAPPFRGRGYAGAILAAFAREALARGIARSYLQVEEGNARAQALYARAGFRPAWTYDYFSADGGAR